MAETFKFTDERFADIQMLRYRLDGFEDLTLKQKLYIYYLAKATLCGRDIVTDQFGRHNLLIRKTLEAVYENFMGDRTSHDFQSMTVYLKRVWFSNGIHHHYGCEKFVPDFSEPFFIEAVRQVGADKLPLAEGQTVDSLLDELCPVIFNPSVQAKRVNQKDGDDLVKTSACNYYENLSQKEVEDFYASMRNPEDLTPISYGLNSTLRKHADGTIHEDVWKEGGLYGHVIKHIVNWLEKAAEVAENPQQTKIINLLISYYRTGDLHVFDQYSIEWLKEQEGRIDFINGFIEVYGDPLGIKASWEGIVTYKDLVATRRTQTISQNAQWFEDHSPVAPQFRKPEVKGVTANVICAAMLGGDEYPASAIGINLPNANWIRETHGSKSVTIGNLTEAYNKAAQGNGFRDEFVIDAETIDLINQYGDITDDLHTDLHECLGHGSGQLLPGTDPDALKAYGNTIEEARADLFGLYYVADHKLVELGLTPNDEAYKAQYYTYLMNGLLTQCIRIKEGDKIEEAHMRNRALIANWTLEHYPEAIQLVKKDSKTFVQITDYQLLRSAFAKLLAEIQRIKSEGDFEAARQLVEKYAVNLDPALHHEILERYKKLDLAPYKGFINPWMKLEYDEKGDVSRVVLDYTESYEHQMLRYSEEYATL